MLNNTPLRLRWTISLMVLAVALPGLAQSEEWVQVKGGAFEVLPAVLSSVKETLEGTVAPKRSEPTEWKSFLLQYRSVYVHGIKTLEIHGSCAFDTRRFNVHAGFYDEQVTDGGDCYFVVFYVIKAKRYSNVVFHGLA